MHRFTVLAGLSLLVASCGTALPPSGKAPEFTHHGVQTPPEPVAPLAVTPLERLIDVQNLQRQGGTPLPVVLVHGLFGFGREEGLGFHYWGGFTDLQQVLKDRGTPTFTASVGPVSSNHDRAVELYYQIKGGCVDYGEQHARQHGHLRTVPGKCFAGFHPRWDASHPVHLVGHSMGGTTVLKLVQLLEEGFFGGSRSGWVKSATTIASPNRGSSAALVLQDFVPKLKEMVLAVGTLAGSSGAFQSVYNFDLEQWGLSRQPGESFDRYWGRVAQSRAWHTEDISAHDLSPAAMNRPVSLSSNTYYFSYSASATQAGLFSGWAYPKLSMNPVLAAIAYPYAWPLQPGIGNYTHAGLGIHRAWWPNDGLVNTINMDAPTGNTSFPLDTSNRQKGRWYNVARLDGYDHLDVIGITTFRNVQPLYINHVNLLQSLP